MRPGRRTPQPPATRNAPAKSRRPLQPGDAAPMARAASYRGLAGADKNGGRSPTTALRAKPGGSRGELGPRVRNRERGQRAPRRVGATPTIGATRQMQSRRRVITRAAARNRQKTLEGWNRAAARTRSNHANRQRNERAAQDLRAAKAARRAGA